MRSRPTHVTHPGRLLAALALAAVIGCGDDDPAGPQGRQPIALPTLWTFNSSLEGWTLGAKAGATATHEVQEGTVVLQGAGTPGEPDAWMSRQVTLPDAELLWIDVRSFDCEAFDPEDSDANIRIIATPEGGAPVVIHDWDHFDFAGTNVADASLEAVGGQTVTLRIEMDDDGDPEGPDTACIDEVEIFIDD